MSLLPWTKRNPINGDVTRLRNEMDRAFERLMPEPWCCLADPQFRRPEGWAPAVDVSETDAEITVRADVPGVPAEDLDINISGTALSIAGTKEEEKEEHGKNFYHCERSRGTFRRIIELPDTIDPEKVSADVDDGVVTIHVAKKPDMKPRHVEVKPAGKKVPVGNP